MTKKKVEELTIEEKLNNALIPVDKQPYEIPKNWCWVRLDSVINLYRGVSYGKNDAHKKKEKDDILILRGGNLGEGYIQIETDNIYVNKNLVNPVQIVKKHDVLIVSSTGSSTVIGKAGISNIDYSDVAFGAFLMLARPKERFNKSYINYFFLTDIYRHRIRLLANGTNINNVRVEHVNGTTFPLPPLVEQERIVNKLDNYISKLNEAKEKLEKVVDTYNYRKNLILHKAFIGQLTKNWRKENPNIELNEDIKNKAITKDSMLPDEYLYEIPENWRWVRLGDIGEIVTGSTPNTKDKSYFGGDVLFIKPTELDQEKNIISSAETLTEKGKQISRPVRKGSTCLCCIGSTIGKCGFLTVEAVTNQQINTVVPYDFLDDLFVYYYCCSKYFKIVVNERSYGNTLPIINKTKTSKLPFPLPPLEEQKEIVKILDSILSKEKQVKEIAEKEIERVEDLKKNLLTRAFGGILGTNDPNEENSIELLKTVL